MARILTFSIPKEDEALLLWLEHKSKVSGLDKSNLVRQGLRLLMEREAGEKKQENLLETKLDRILGDLEILKGWVGR